MNVTIPVLVTEQKQQNSAASVQIVRPLFSPEHVEQAESLQRALNKLANNLRAKIELLGREARHESVAEICRSPALTAKVVDLRLNLGAENFDCRYLFVSFAGFGRRLVLTPNVPEVWFELDKGEDLQIRAMEVLDEHFRRLERVHGRGTQNPAAYNFAGKTWLTNVDFDVSLPQIFEPKEENLFALLGMAEKMNGAEELRKTGRNLDSLYPNDLERTAGREKQLAQLTELLDSSNNRPVLLVGKPGVGKTALVHEYVFRQVEKRISSRAAERNTWLLAPARLIAGMMYVGQWEERLLAILKEAGAKKHLLYFQDLLGLFFAGQSRDSNLSMGQVIKPYVEKREVRLLAEITAEGLRVLQERDRSFADLFQIVRLDETGDDETLQIILRVRREQEQIHDCRFALDSLPVALDLTRRYVREAAFPGKAASFLKQLAVKFRGREISRADVLTEFEAKSGLSVAFLDDKIKLERHAIIEKLSGGIIGQRAAIEAAADVISIAKARLNDQTRPLASFLFLGATGVGKTEAAKQIASYLYGAEDKLLRFDMNEFVSPFDAARLVGTFEQPEGLLTSAIRRQPFSVILLDEIEKAHPDVFNLLLQVMGDGRLTDALGRTADFTNAIVLLTSNLGAREAGVKLGFRQTDESESHIYRQTAEKFFRPEFFNRLDRVIAFERLQRAEVEQIADKQLEKVFARDGLLRRNCKLNLSPEAMALIVNEGYHPQLGARALKRAVEKYLTAPVAAALSALSPDAPLVIKIEVKDKKIAASVDEIKPAALVRSIWLASDFTNVEEELDLIADALDRLEAAVEFLKPAGEINPNDAGQARYFLIREQIRRVERMIGRAEKWSGRDRLEIQNPKSKAQSSRSRSPRNLVSLRDSGIDFAKLLSLPNLALKLKELAAENRFFGEDVADYLQDIWRETSLLQATVENLATPNDERCLLLTRASEPDGDLISDIFDSLYQGFFSNELGLKFSFAKMPASSVESIMIIEGAHAFPLARCEVGAHLIATPQSGFSTVEARVLKIGAAEDFKADFAALWEPAEAENKSVVRIYERIGSKLRYALDFQSGLIAGNVLTERELRAFALSGLPVPPELS